MSQLFLPLHLLSLLYVAWNVIRADHAGFLWMTGKEQLLSKKDISTYHHGTWIGLGLMIITGSVLFYPMREFLLTRPQFYIKMGFVFTLIINGLVIGKISHIATEKTFISLSTREKAPLLISGAISTISWIGAIVAAFFLIPE